jgi:hypothetical protein
MGGEFCSCQGWQLAPHVKKEGAVSMSAWWVIGINICVAFVVVLSTLAMLKPIMT